MLSKIVVSSCVYWALFALPLRAEEPGGATPEAVFEKYQKAVAEEKYKIAFSQTTPDSQAMAISGMLSLVFLSTGSGGATPQHAVEAAELDAVLKKHGAGLEKVVADFKNLEQVISRVKDKPACLEECMNCLKKWDGGKFIAGGGKDDPFVSAKMVDLVVQEDEASATLMLKQDGKEVSQPIKFKKMNGTWLIDSTYERGPRGQDSNEQTTEDGNSKGRPYLPPPSR